MSEYHLSIADGWKSYRDEVVPKDAGPIQLLECERAFYAGAVVALNASLEIGNDAAIREIEAYRKKVEAEESFRKPPSRSGDA